jgi:hypothetical protein
MMKIVMRTAAPLLAAAVLTAGGTSAQGRVVQLPERDRVLPGQPAQVFAIGKAEGAEHEMFGEATAAAFDAADNLYVLDRMNARVMVYDRTGRFLRQIGRKGQGPGELTAPMQLGVAADGSVVVSDVARPGYALFRPDGTFNRNVLTPAWWPAGFRTPLSLHPSGGVVGAFMPAPAAELNPNEPPEQRNATPVMFIPFAGGEPRRVFNVPARARTTQSQQDGRGGASTIVRSTAAPVFSPRVHTGVLPSGQVAMSFTTGYTVRVVDMNGQTLRYIQRPIRPRATTRGDRERWLATQRERIARGEGGVTITAPGRTISSERIRAAVQGLMVAPTGKMWIERTPPEIGGNGPIDLVTPEGQYLGTITGTPLPDALSRGGLAAYLERDDDGVPRVVVRRLPQAWR